MRRLLGIPIIVVLLAAGACGGDGDSAQGGERATVKVAMLSLVTNAPYYIAVKEKLFEAEGLQVETQPVQQSTQAYPALKTGAIDIVFANNASMLLGHDKGDLPINLIVEGTTLTPSFMAVLVMPGSPIKDIGDLAGKRVSVHVLNNIQAITLNAVAADQGLDPARIDYRQVVFPQMAATMQKGDLDAIHVNEPFLTDAKLKLGARQVVDGGAAPVTGIPMDGYFALQGWAQRNPETAAKFQRAMQKAQGIAADRAKVEEVVPTYIRNADPAVTEAMHMPGFPTSNDPARLQKLIDLMVSQKRLTTKLDATKIVYQG
ncbi:sulfonate ABC transporter substrate-binding protein [Paractinoplanes deccanensis]|uniref:Sulfonate ABC transporter substrate-binding protein n=1 Tax=Paractinoplanes deccanensis TaxID=113561 RepID=A0ABQ3YHJ8_9ACTN|nr:ABC transporter substrate-binding protein [Actinoplanes deccanensis]GID79490.1 sulfonate ABC transporter substrate-binding protein [Actinoplanes deccanensis]